MSVDGTDCPINEPWSFEKKWYYQKFNGPAVKYEVGSSIKNGLLYGILVLLLEIRMMEQFSKNA
eukprot:15364715-Ditylum_brightwellii.AAC.1